MEVNIEKTTPCVRRMSITVAVNDVDHAFDQVYREFGKTARIPGFRPGKAPRGLLDMHYGSQMRNEVQNRLVSNTLFKAIEESQENPVAMPKVEPGNVSRGAAFQYTAEFEVQPQIEITRYKGLAVETPSAEVADAEVEAQLETLRQQSTQLVPVMVRDVAQAGDVVVIDYVASMGGVPLPGAKGENALVELGGEGYLPGLADGLMGAKVPSERDVPVTFPEDFSAKDMAGKQATFHVKIKELKTRELPKLDDEFAKDLGEESLAALQAKVRADLEQRKQASADEARRASLLKALVEANPFDLAPSMVSQQADRMIAAAAARMEQMFGQRVQLSSEQQAALRKEHEGEAELQVRSGLLLLEVAKKEKIEVSDDDLDAEVARIAEGAGESAARVRAYYADADQRERLRYRLIEDKTVQLLLDQTVDSAAAAPNIETGSAEKSSSKEAKATELEKKEGSSKARKAAATEDAPAAKTKTKKKAAEPATDAGESKPKRTRKKKEE